MKNSRKATAGALDTLALNAIITKRDRVIEGLYLVFEELGISRSLAWERAEELMAAKAAASSLADRAE